MGDNIHTTLNVAVLGPLGTYTHEAAQSVFGSRVHYQYQRTITDVFDSFSGDIHVAVVPRENSLHGIVTETYDNLRSCNHGFITGEVVLKVQHCLVVRTGVALHDIKRVLSHEQALGQCQAFLKTYLPDAELVKTPSTASAARALLDEPSNCAAICSKSCASLFDGLEVLREGIQIEEANFTRFLILTKSREQSIRSQFGIDPCYKALLRIYANDEKADNLMRIFDLLDTEMCLTQIDRRPKPNGAPFHDVYFAEVKKIDGTVDSQDEEYEWSAAVDKLVLSVGQAGYDAVALGIW
ncbi:Prephenate dehydratase domain containing protein [Amanita muscaria]